MSVTIRYHGALQDLGRIEAMQEEFLDIACTNEWPSEIVDGSFSSLRKDASEGAKGARGAAVGTMSPPLTLRGIKLTVHPQTDPLWFTFDDAGQLTRLGFFAVDHYAGRKGSEALTRKFEFVHQSQASIQTTVGGTELHRCVVKLLEHLKSRYVPDLQVSDDSGFWEDHDEARLARLMSK
jgi:hypothetical protein